MHCSHCNSLMAEVGVQRDSRTEQTLYECPICQRTQLVTRTLHQWRNDAQSTTHRLAKRTLRQV
jgi:phage FluMu protein Com